MAEPGKLLFVTSKSERKLRQLVGAPNTTDYGSDGTADTPQQNIKRKDTNTATEEVQGHSFDVELVNNGSEDTPSYSVHIYNSALPDSPYAGVVYVYEYQINVPVTELPVSSDTGFFVALDLNYVKDGNPPYSVALSIIPFGSGGQVEYTTYRIYIAEGKIPNAASRISDDIWVSGRWV